jgi:hypothetical protein
MSSETYQAHPAGPGFEREEPSAAAIITGTTIAARTSRTPIDG